MSGNLVCMIVTRSREAEKVWSTKTNPIITVSTTSVLHKTLAADPMLVTMKKIWSDSSLLNRKGKSVSQ